MEQLSRAQPPRITEIETRSGRKGYQKPRIVVVDRQEGEEQGPSLSGLSNGLEMPHIPKKIPTLTSSPFLHPAQKNKKKTKKNVKSPACKSVEKPSKRGCSAIRRGRRRGDVDQEAKIPPPRSPPIEQESEAQSLCSNHFLQGCATPGVAPPGFCTEPTI